MPIHLPLLSSLRELGICTHFCAPWHPSHSLVCHPLTLAPITALACGRQLSGPGEHLPPYLSTTRMCLIVHDINSHAKCMCICALSASNQLHLVCSQDSGFWMSPAESSSAQPWIKSFIRKHPCSMNRPKSLYPFGKVMQYMICYHLEKITNYINLCGTHFVLSKCNNFFNNVIVYNVITVHVMMS